MALAFTNLQRFITLRAPCPNLQFTRNLSITRTSAPKRAIIPPPRDPAVFQYGTGPYALPAEPIKTAEDFLKAIGRSSETKITGTWQELWKMDGRTMRQAGLSVRDRKYILWCMEKYRLGFPIREFAHEPPPKKTIRGWGPKVQNGKRIRSRRIKDKTKKKPSQSFLLD